jgi:hypothetical protein
MEFSLHMTGLRSFSKSLDTEKQKPNSLHGRGRIIPSPQCWRSNFPVLRSTATQTPGLAGMSSK